MQGFQLIINFLVMPLFFLSGSLFPLEGMPKGITYIAIINPLSYGVDGIRGALTGATTFGMLTDFLVLSIVGTILIFVGSYLFSRIEV
jgi:ABC-2 type transport system permease protein